MTWVLLQAQDTAYDDSPQHKRYWESGMDISRVRMLGIGVAGFGTNEISIGTS